jgi:hypothetical protein
MRKIEHPCPEDEGLGGVDFKSTVIHNRFAFLLLYMLLDHLICNMTPAHGRIATGPEMFAPKLLLQMRKL